MCVLAQAGTVPVVQLTNILVCKLKQSSYICGRNILTIMAGSKEKQQELTRAELEIMQIAWKLGKEFIVRDIYNEMPEPKPAYNTVSTFVRILDTKGFLTHKSYGHVNVYMPALSKSDYTGTFMQGVLNSFFDGSISRMVTFFSARKDISMKEADEILQVLNNSKKD